jgi:hypothetical protein
VPPLEESLPPASGEVPVSVDVDVDVDVDVPVVVWAPPPPPVPVAVVVDVLPPVARELPPQLAMASARAHVVTVTTIPRR